MKRKSIVLSTLAALSLATLVSSSPLSQSADDSRFLRDEKQTEKKSKEQNCPQELFAAFVSSSPDKPQGQNVKQGQGEKLDQVTNDGGRRGAENSAMTQELAQLKVSRIDKGR